jgi:hypothetical protein
MVDALDPEDLDVVADGRGWAVLPLMGGAVETGILR